VSDISAKPCTNREVCTRLPGIVSFDEQRAILRIAGDEDRATIGRRRRALSVALSASRDVIVDLTDLHFADASLMIDLACLAQRLRSRERTLWLSAAQPHVRRLIQTVGLDRLPAVRFVGGHTAVPA
jgi:anti-anti-sigma factor